MAQVLVTGGSGYVAAHCIVKALAAGHMVRTSLRSLRRADEVRSAVLAGGVDPDRLVRLTFSEADLNDDAGWSEATTGCDYVLHVASPFPSAPPVDPQDLIRPARDGALRVLRASVAQGIKRVVLTSSFAAIGYGHATTGRSFDERDWTDIAGPDANPYIQSKTIAEQAAWDFMQMHGRDTVLCVINPTGIFGPTLSRNLSASVDLIRLLMAGGMPVAPLSYFGVVDVRDVADLHLLAMTAEGAVGQRLLATTEPQESLLSVARIIGQGFPSLKDRLPTQEVADHSSDLASSVSTRRPASAAKARALGWSPRSPAETILDTAESLIEFGIVTLPQSQATDP